MRRSHIATMLVCWLLITAVDARSQFVSETVYRAITAADQLAEKNRAEEALDKLREILGKSTLSLYERSVLNRMAGVIYANSGKDAEAAGYFEQVLHDAQLPEDLLRQTRYHLAYIYTQQEKYSDVLPLLEPAAQRQPELTAEESFILAFAYLGLEQASRALPWAERTLQLSDDAELPEHYLNLAINTNLMLERHLRAEELLDQAVRRYPGSTNYWRQLVAVRLELREETQALATMELGYLQGALAQPQDLTSLAHLYLQKDMPYQAAGIFQQLINRGDNEDGELHRWLAIALEQAREYASAIPHLAKAAQASKDGQLFLQLARLHVELEDWTAASRTIARALAKGHLKNPAGARLLQGIIHVQLNEIAAAERSFLYCLDFKETREQALQWLESLGHIQAENSN